MLSYCTNVHPAETLAGIWETLSRCAVPLKRKASPDGPLGLGLYLPAAAAEPLAARPESAADFLGFLQEEGLGVVTVNAFPYGGFHGERVKEGVYRPDWTSPKRLDYTLLAGRALAALLLPGATGTLSTLPGSWKAWDVSEEALDRMALNLLSAAAAFHRIREETGRTLVLCLEPEPGCTIENTPETLAFFERRLLAGGAHRLAGLLGTGPSRAEEVARRHLGVCLDTCHLALQFENLPDSIRRLSEAGIRIGKAQLSSALVLKDPGRSPEGVRALQAFDEPRFLHQVTARTPSGIQFLPDLTLLDAAPEAWASASEWRCHFHVPLDRAAFPPLGTTQAELKAVLPTLLALPEPPHLEIETYTWSVLPERERPRDEAGLVEGLAREFAWVKAELARPGRP